MQKKLLLKILFKVNIIYIYEELKKVKFKKLWIDEIRTNIIDLYEDKNEEIIIKNSSYLFNPKISVIIPIYNSIKYLNDCLNSIVNQT